MVKDTYGNAMARLLEYAQSAETAYLNAQKAETDGQPHKVENFLCLMQIECAMMRSCINELAQL